MACWAEPPRGSKGASLRRSPLCQTTAPPSRFIPSLSRVAESIAQRLPYKTVSDRLGELQDPDVDDSVKRRSVLELLCQHGRYCVDDDGLEGFVIDTLWAVRARIVRASGGGFDVSDDDDPACPITLHVSKSAVRQYNEALFSADGDGLCPRAGHCADKFGSLPSAVGASKTARNRGQKARDDEIAHRNSFSLFQIGDTVRELVS